jgi:hypothetical protein
MIVGFISKGAGILVLPAWVVPFLFAAIVENALVPDRPPGNHLWILGSALLLSSILLWWTNRYFKQGARPMLEKSATDGYTKFSRKQAKDPSHFQTNFKRRFQSDHDTGWFMFIPTGFWPFPIAALGLFLIIGSLVAL